MSLPSEPKSTVSPDEIQAQALAWFARMQDSNVSPQDRDAFDDWLAAHPNHRAAYDRVVQLWQSPELSEAMSRYAVLPLPPKARQMQSKHWLSAASVLLASAWLLSVSGTLEHLQADALTSVGEQRRIELADGSVVTMNTDTALSFNDDGERRGVSLFRGEAYFEVKPDKSRPFLVETEQGSIRVLGTRFSVTAGDRSQVDVESGIVLCSGAHGESRRLTAGQHTVISERGVAEVNTIDAAQVFAWLKGRLIFQDQTLSEVLAELERYHPGLIVITDAELARIHITGNYKLDNTDAVIQALVEIAGAKVIRLTPYLTVLKS